MKSPFPGMDPYIEAHWRDVHHRLCTYACDALQPQVRPAMLARIEERLVVESDPGDDRSIYHDVKVVQPRAARPDASVPAGAALADEPLLVRVEDETPTEGFIQIIDPATGGKLVTVIEFFSTSNKLPGEGQRQYRQKQRELRESGVSLVEIDLLRTGDWIVQVPRRLVPDSSCPYRVCVHRGWKAGEYEFYRIPLDRRLPIIRVPLRESDPDARLDLQSLIDQIYLNGAYETLDYTRPPTPPLAGDAAAWAQDIIQQAGRNAQRPIRSSNAGPAEGEG